MGELHNLLQLNYKASEFSRLLGLDEQNDSIYGVVLVCNPFKGPPNYNYVPESCPEDAIHISQLPQVSEPYSCHGFQCILHFCRLATLFLKIMI